MVKTKDINKDLLEERIKSSGLRIGYIIDALGITRQAFHMKRIGAVCFRQSEIFVLSTLLHLSESDKQSIFFASEVAKNSNSEVEG